MQAAICIHKPALTESCTKLPDALVYLDLYTHVNPISACLAIQGKAALAMGGGGMQQPDGISKILGFLYRWIRSKPSIFGFDLGLCSSHCLPACSQSQQSANTSLTNGVVNKTRCPCLY